MGYCLGKDPYITTFLLKREKSCGFWDCADKEVKFSQIEISRSGPGESCCTIWSQVGTYAGKFMQVIAIEIFRTGNTELDVFVASEVDGKYFEVTSESYAQEVDVAVVLEDGEHPFTLHRAVVQ